jgi:hypothetical protein
MDERSFGIPPIKRRMSAGRRQVLFK